MKSSKSLIHLGDGLYEEVTVKNSKKDRVMYETSRDRFGETRSGVILKEGEQILNS